MSSESGWNEIRSGRAGRNTDLEESEWIKHYSVDGPFEKICLHRLSGKKRSGKILLCLPGTWSSGEQLMHVSYHGMGYSAIPLERGRSGYLASQGHTVYALDYRTHFVPPFLKERELSFMREWGWEKWISDIREAISFILKVEEKESIILEGDSFGGIAAANYASRYGGENLSGLVLMDGGPVREQSLSFIYDGKAKSVKEMDEKGIYSVPSIGGTNNPIWSFVLRNPDVPAPVPGFKNVEDLLMHNLDSIKFTNSKAHPFSKREFIFPVLATFDPYWPYRINMELKDQEFGLQYCGAKLPCIFFSSGNFGSAMWDESLLPEGTMKVLLDGYGHLDVYTGENVFNDVISVASEWTECMD